MDPYAKYLTDGPTRSYCPGSVSKNHNEPDYQGKCSWCGYHLGRPRVNTDPGQLRRWLRLDERIRRNFRDERQAAEGPDGPDEDELYYGTLPYWPY